MDREDIVKAKASFGYEYVYVGVFNDIRYNTKVSLNGRNLTLICGYNNRSKERWVSLETGDKTVLLKRTPLIEGRVCELDPVSWNYGLDYYITLSKKDINKELGESYDYLNWGNDFRIAFVGKPYSSNKEMKRLLLNVLVGE